MDKMEKTPLLSSKQQKKTLKAKTKKQKSSLRHVFATPYERYWPLLDERKEMDLADTLERALIPAKIPTPNVAIPWSTLVKLSGEERKEMRASASCKSPDTYKEVRSSLLLGINAVTRSLEKGETSVVLLANDIDPPMLGHHVSDLCTLKRTPLIAMRFLRKVTKQSLGFSCIAVGIKCGTTHFEELQGKILELVSFFPMPDGPQFQKVTEDVDDDDESSEIDKQEWDSSKLKDIYLYRQSKKERVFIPRPFPRPLVPPAEGSLKFDTDFISFGTSGTKSYESLMPLAQSKTEIYCFTKPLGIDEIVDLSEESTIKCLTEKQNVSQYKPLIVKTMKPNPNKKRKRKK